MESFTTSAAFQTYAICSVILALKMLASAAYTARQRSVVGGYVNKEDARFGGEGVAAEAMEKPEVAHALRIQRNDLENIPVFWALGLLYVLTGASAIGAAAYFWTFTVARVAHTFFYIRQAQPGRALLWLLGLLCLIGMSVQIIWRSL